MNLVTNIGTPYSIFTFFSHILYCIATNLAYINTADDHNPKKNLTHSNVLLTINPFPIVINIHADKM